MIEIPGRIKVLRYREEEIRRMRPPRGSIPEHSDWFTPMIEKRYQKWRVYRVLQDWTSEEVYVILVKDFFQIKQTMKRKGNEVWVEEEVV